jgi:hypothetical protein
MVELALSRMCGHPDAWDGGVRDAEIEGALSAGVPAADGGVGPIRANAREACAFEPTAQSIWHWGRQAERDGRARRDGGVTSPEREELTEAPAREPSPAPGARYSGKGGGLVRAGEDPERLFRVMSAPPRPNSPSASWPVCCGSWSPATAPGAAGRPRRMPKPMPRCCAGSAPSMPARTAPTARRGCRPRAGRGHDDRPQADGAADARGRAARCLPATLPDDDTARADAQAGQSSRRPRLHRAGAEPAVRRRRPMVVHRTPHLHAERGGYTSLAFGMRCQEAGVRPCTGAVGDA